MRIRHTTESYIAMVSEIHSSKYDYNKTTFVDYKTTITVICPLHGEFYPTAGNHKKTGCPQCYEARRGPTMPEAEFRKRLSEKYSHITLVGAYTTASEKTLLACTHHGLFKIAPTRALQWAHACPICAKGSIAKHRADRNAPKIERALSSLPKHIKPVGTPRGWSVKSTLCCEYHGEFDIALNRVEGLDFVCNECAKAGLKGEQRTDYADYAAKLARLFPNPPSPITLDPDYYDINVGTKVVNLICETHGPFTRNRSTVNNGIVTPCPYCKTHGASSTELAVVEFLRQYTECAQGVRNVISPMEIDCWVPQHRLAVELCGLYWHSERKLPNDYHTKKLERCDKAGVRLVQIFEDEWVNKQPICQSILRNALGMTQNRFYARALQMCAVEGGRAKLFLEENHIQGYTPASHYLGLFAQDELIALASFSFNRLKKDSEWELVRYCSKLNTSVLGGLSKLVHHFLKSQQLPSLISYCCLRWFDGSGYLAAGFKLEGRTKPSYFYTKGSFRLSRYSAQKHKLHKLLDHFDPKMTEVENMAANDYYRVFDCGNLLFRFTL